MRFFRDDVITRQVGTSEQPEWRKLKKRERESGKEGGGKENERGRESVELKVQCQGHRFLQIIARTFWGRVAIHKQLNKTEFVSLSVQWMTGYR